MCSCPRLSIWTRQSTGGASCISCARSLYQTALLSYVFMSSSRTLILRWCDILIYVWSNQVHAHRQGTGIFHYMIFDIYLWHHWHILPLTLSSISHLPDGLHDHWHIPIYLIHLLSYIKLCMSLYVYDPLSFYPYYPDIHYKMYVSLFIWPLSISFFFITRHGLHCSYLISCKW